MSTPQTAGSVAETRARVRWAEITTRTPLHIGTGANYSLRQDLYWDPKRKQYAALDVDKIGQRLAEKANFEQALADWISGIQNKPTIQDALPKNWDQDDFAQVAKYWIKQIQTIPNGKNDNPTIRQQLRTQIGERALPMLPGSSIKGGLRTAWLASNHTNNGINPATDINPNNGQDKHADKHVMRKVFASDVAQSNAPNHDLFRRVRPSDVHFAAETEFQRVVVYTLRNNGLKDKGTPLYCECIPKGKTAYVCFTENDNLVKVIGHAQDKGLALGDGAKALEAICSDKLDTSSLLQKAHAHTISWLKKELDTIQSDDFKGGLPGYKDWLVESLERAEELKKAEELGEKTYWLRVGFGGGWKAMTGDWLGSALAQDRRRLRDVYDTLRKSNYKGLPMPKSRRLTSDFEPLGLLEIKLLDDRPAQGLIPSEGQEKPSTARSSAGLKPSESSQPIEAPAETTLDPTKQRFGPKFKAGEEIVAQVSHCEGKQVFATINLQDGTALSCSFTYAAGLAAGQWVRLRIKGVVAGGTQIQGVDFRGKL